VLRCNYREKEEKKKGFNFIIYPFIKTKKQKNKKTKKQKNKKTKKQKPKKIKYKQNI